jgi:hypothetical protein
VSQLPFGANDKLDNLVSVLLTVGSPALAGYSLALTVLNGRWIARHFAAYNYPNIRYAVQILSSLQQSPLTVTTTDSLLASLVVLPENDQWWRELVIWLNYTHTWSVSAVTSIAWVIIAYLFTLIDSLTADPTPSIELTGRGIGSLWFWLLPIVIGWLQLSPKCDSTRLRQAIERANNIAYVATPSGMPVLAGTVSMQRAISFSPSTDELLRCDEQCTAPIYNYSRLFPWTQAVEEVREVFRVVSDRAHRHRAVDPLVSWEISEKCIAARNRMGILSEVDAYCLSVGEPAAAPRSSWGHAVWPRFILASLFALSLQWGTVGAAIFIAWHTPTVGKWYCGHDRLMLMWRHSSGFGCRSGSYLLYGVFSTISWVILVFSSLLSHYSATALPENAYAWIAAQLSIALRRLGKIIASLNAIWIIAACLFQFSNFYSRCYCNSNVISLGARAYDVIFLNPEDISAMKGAWIGGAFIAAGCAAICVVTVNLFINPELPGPEPE